MAYAHSLTHSLTSPVLHQPDKVSAETMSGKTADGRTVLSNESEIFKTEAINTLRSTIFTDIKNLNKARKVTWNDAQGKVSMSRIKQLFDNIKHNIRAIWIGKKGELKASAQLKTDIRKFEILLKKTVIDSDLKKDCEAFYNELKGKRPGGYAYTKEKITALIGNNDANRSLKADVEKFLRGHIPDNDEKFGVTHLKERFKSTFGNVDSKTNDQIKNFTALLQSYESKLPSKKLENEIKKLFENQLRDEACKQACRDIDTKRDELIEHIDAFAKGDYGFSGVTRMDWGDYYTDYATDGETTDKVENAEWKAFEQLKGEIEDAFANNDGTDFKSLLAGVRGKNNTVKQLKVLVNDAAKAQKEKIKNEKPIPKESFVFLKNLPQCLNRELEGEDQVQTLTDRTLDMFDKSLQGFKKTREKLVSLLDAHKEESDFSVFNRLENMLEEVKITEGWDIPSADE